MSWHCSSHRFPRSQLCGAPQSPAHLGVGHVHDVLVPLHTLHHVEAVPVQDLGLGVSGHHQDHVTRVAVLQGPDLMTVRDILN